MGISNPNLCYTAASLLLNLMSIALDNSTRSDIPVYTTTSVFALIFFHLLARKPNLEKCSIYSNKFFHNFHLSESSVTCHELRTSACGLVRRLQFEKKNCITVINTQ